VYPKPSQRVLRTWPLNCLWIEFFLALGVDDSEATCAEEQLFAFRKCMKWNESSQLLAGFMAALQLWYFGVPVEQVWDSSRFLSMITTLLIVYTDCFRSCLQLRTFEAPSYATATLSVLFEDMKAYVASVKQVGGLTIGNLSPCHLFVDDTTVPECTRYTARKVVLEHSVKASSSDLSRIAAAREQQRKRRKIA
jgi:hypothetical protein